MAAAINRWISYVLLGIGAALIAFGIYLGFFAWINDGPRVGLRVFGISAAFGAGLAVAGWAFRFAATAHARGEPRRWWIQALAVMIGYFAFGLAASASSFLDRI